NQIAATTSYGTTNLLNGSFSNQTLQVGAFDVSTQQINLAISAADANSLGVGSTGGAGASVQAVVGDQNLVFASGATSVSLTAAEHMTVTEGNVTALVTVASGVTLTQAQFAATIDSQLSAIGIAATITSAGSLELYSTSGTAFSAVDSGATFIGTTAVAATAVTIATGVSVDTQSNAQAAISAVQSAISMVDSIEASVGAVQNQLQAIAANLTVGQQNLTAANSQLVDVNMAQEMTTFSTDQILMQTGTSMLAQAQQAPQLVLKLI
ncbi:MAG: flagellin, partial [Actinomycetota bacterium]|nr:flagellin [Actinomycetota bacterium]